MKKILKKINNKKGSFSILFVIISFIAIIFTIGMIDIMYKMFSINEIQGVLDDAGVAALHSGVDDNMWRLEELKINETLVLNNFHKMVNEHLSAGGDSKLTSIDVTAKIIPPNHPGLKKLGIPSGERNQYFLVSEAYARYKSNSLFDGIGFASLEYFNFFQGSKESIQYHGAAEDGIGEIVVRSVSRLVLR